MIGIDCGVTSILFWTILFALTSCKIDPPLQMECPQVPLDATNVYPEKVYRNAPVANPLSLYEFAYVATDDDISGIWKYNLQTNTKALILEFDIWETPDWSTTDWIVFGSAQQLFKCKSDGDSLTQLTFSHENYDPCWSPDGEKIVYWRRDDDSNLRTVIMDKNGIVLDSLNSITGYPPSWSPEIITFE